MRSMPSTETHHFNLSTRDSGYFAFEFRHLPLELLQGRHNSLPGRLKGMSHVWANRVCSTQARPQCY